MEYNEKQDLKGFKQAIRDDHSNRILKLRAEIEDQLADIVVSKRMNVEKQMEEIRSEHKHIFQSRLRGIELRSKQQLRDCLMEIHSEKTAALEENIKQRILQFKCDREIYRKVLHSLVNEGYDLLKKPFVLYLAKEDFPLYTCEEPVLEIKELYNDVWGGCILETIGPGRVIIDNTFKTRWSRMLPRLSERLTYEIDRCLGPNVQELSRELRIS